MKLRSIALMLCLVSLVAAGIAQDRNWQTGTLTGTERQKVPSGTRITSNTDGSAKDRGNKTDYSENKTTNKTQEYDTYQLFTIQSDNTIYEVSEHLFFPWSKPASLILGKPVKFALNNDTMYILDSNNKEHKASVIKTSLKQ